MGIENMIFKGLEREGKFKGLPTLFIAGAYPYQTIVEYLEQEPRIAHVYFGAGRNHEYDFDSLRMLTESPSLLTTVETTSPLKLPEEVLLRAHIMLIDPTQADYIKQSDTIKFETDKAVYCVQKGNMLRTPTVDLEENTHYRGDSILRRD